MVRSITKRIIQNRSEIWEHGLATAAAVVSRMSMLIITLMNSRYLEASEFGMFVILLLVANIVTAFVSCGGDMWLNRFTRLRHTHFDRAPIVSRFYLTFSAFLAGLVCLVALGFAIVGQQWFSGHGFAIALMLLWAATAGFIEAILAVLRTTNDLQRFFIIRDFFMPIGLILAIVVLQLNSCVQFFLTSFLMWLGTLLILLNVISRRSKLKFLSAHRSIHHLRKELTGYTLGLILNNFSSRFANALDTLLLTRFVSMELIGGYRVYSHFSNAFTVVQHFAFLALPWHLRGGYGETHEQSRLRTIRLRQLLLVVSSFTALLVCILLGKFILRLLNPEFQTMASLFYVFLIIRFSELLWGPQHEKLISNNKVIQDTVSNGVGIVIALIVFSSSFYYLSAILSAVIAAGLSSIGVQLARSFFLQYQNQKQASLVSKTSLLTWLKSIPWISIGLTLTSIIGLFYYGSFD